MTVLESNFLEEEEKTTVIEYYKQGNQRLRDILDKYNPSKDVFSLKQEISELVTLNYIKRFDDISSPTNSALFEPKIQKLKNFRFLINYYYVTLHDIKYYRR